MIAFTREGHGLGRETVYFKGIANILFPKLSCIYILIIISILWEYYFTPMEYIIIKITGWKVRKRRLRVCATYFVDT